MSFRVNKRKQSFPRKDYGLKKMKAIARSGTPSAALIKRVILSQEEKKYFETNTDWSTYLLSGSNYVQCINQIKLGSEFNNRIGRRVRNQSVHTLLNITTQTVSGSVGATWVLTGRYALVWDTEGDDNQGLSFQQNTTTDTVPGVFDSTVSTYPSVNMTQNAAQGSRWKVLRTCMYAISDQNPIFQLDWFVPLDGIVSDFGNVNSSAYNSWPTKGRLLVVVGTDQAIPGGVTPVVNNVSRVVYTDA